MWQDFASICVVRNYFRFIIFSWPNVRSTPSTSLRLSMSILGPKLKHPDGRWGNFPLVSIYHPVSQRNARSLFERVLSRQTMLLTLLFLDFFDLWFFTIRTWASSWTAVSISLFMVVPWVQKATVIRDIGRNEVRIFFRLSCCFLYFFLETMKRLSFPWKEIFK